MYRAIYKTTRAETKASIGGDGMFVFGMTLAGVCAGFGLFTLIHSTFSESLLAVNVKCLDTSMPVVK